MTSPTRKQPPPTTLPLFRPDRCWTIRAIDIVQDSPKGVRGLTIYRVGVRPEPGIELWKWIYVTATEPWFEWEPDDDPRIIWNHASELAEFQSELMIEREADDLLEYFSAVHGAEYVDIRKERVGEIYGWEAPIRQSHESFLLCTTPDYPLSFCSAADRYVMLPKLPDFSNGT
jgi:hypothetical protein